MADETTRPDEDDVQAHGPRTEGPRTEGPRTEKTSDDEPDVEAHGPRTEGPRTEVRAPRVRGPSESFAVEVLRPGRDSSARAFSLDLLTVRRPSVSVRSREKPEPRLTSLPLERVDRCRERGDDAELAVAVREQALCVTCLEQEVHRDRRLVVRRGRGAPSPAG